MTFFRTLILFLAVWAVVTALALASYVFVGLGCASGLNCF